MHKRNRLYWRKIVLGAPVLVVLLAGAWLVASGAEQGRPDQAVREAWSLMQQAGQYEFSSTVEQTTYPAPALVNVGRSSSKEVYYASGSSDLRSRAMQISLWQEAGSLLNPGDKVEVRLEGDNAFGRVAGSPWQEIENFSAASFAPGKDASAYLVAAQNVRYIESERISAPGVAHIQVSRYAFDVDADRFAAYLRDQMVAELQRAGELPLGMELDFSDAFRGMVGEGSLWVDGTGLPVRLQVNLQMAPKPGGERVEMQVKTDFFNHARENLRASQPFSARLAGMLGLPSGPAGWDQAAMLAGFSSALLALCALAVLYSRKRWVYASVAGLVILSMLVSPIWQSANAAAFTRRMADQQQSSESERQQIETRQEQAQALLSASWDPHLDPLAAPAGRIDNSEVEGTPSTVPAAQAVVVSDEAAVDSDGDGLTDAYENQVNADAAELGYQVLDPNNPDTDGDGLNDAQEIRLNLSPAQPDSDNDGLPDKNEVSAFFYSIDYWYSDPLEKDTDKDGILDGTECPQRVDSLDAACQDTDSDGVPDLFDADDDGDTVPSLVDESPLATALSEKEYSGTSPFQFTVTGADPGLPVFITYQVRPLKPEHLTYALNVLDWPSGDTDGQVQRISNSTFADSLTAGQKSADPRSANGDLRLIPMLEVKLDSGHLPLPLTDHIRLNLTSTDFQGVFSLTGDGSSGTLLRLEQVDLGPHPAPVYLGAGGCKNITGGSRVASLDIHGEARLNDRLGSLTSGTRVLYVKNADETSVLACAEIPAVAHGAQLDYVVDDGLLAKYGASARQDRDGAVLVYAPLSLVKTNGGDVGVAFSSTIPFTNQGSRLNGASQQVRVVWLLNMLTDVCKPKPAGDTSTNWCDQNQPAHWETNLPTVVHTYDEEFTLTGLTLKQELGVNLAVVFEDPAHDTQPQYEDPTWLLARGLEASFVSGRLSAANTRDVTVAEIEHRFDPDNPGNNNGDIPAGDARLWGITEKATFQVVRHHYAFSEEVYRFIETDGASLFNTYFDILPASQQVSETTLLFAREESSRSIMLGDIGSTCGGGSCSFDLAQRDPMVTAVLNWAPYRKVGQVWEAYPLDAYLDQLEVRMRALDTFQATEATEEARQVMDGQIQTARLYYESMYRGMAKLVSLNGAPVVNIPDVLTDIQVRDQYFHTQGRFMTIAKVTRGVASMVLREMMLRPGFVAASMTFGKTVDDFFKTIKQMAVDKYQSWVTKYGKTGARLLGIGGAVLLVGVVGVMIWTWCDPNSEASRITARVMGTAMGLISAYMTYRGIQSLAAFKQTASASAKAAVIGLVVGLVITWGVFFAQWSASGASAGSLAADNLAADAIASTCTLVLFALLACTGVGAIIVGIIGVIDSIISAICAAMGWDQLGPETWQHQWFCAGITGLVTKLIKWAIYSVTFLVNYDDSNRLSFSNLNQGLVDPLAGMTTGNKLTASLKVTNAIELSDIPIDWKAAFYFWQFSDDTAKSSSWRYKLQSAQNDLHGGLERYSNNDVWEDDGAHKWKGNFTAATDASGVALPQPGINRDPAIYFSEGSAVPVQECIVVPMPFSPFWGLWPVCWVRTERATTHIDMGSSFTVDVFPNTLDEFYALSATGNGGYALAWGRDATLKFPTLKDADGDGLQSRSVAGGNDPDDSRFDSDGDGLSDSAELQEGTSPLLFDTDDDGLTDTQEIALGTSPVRKDTDADGLTDQEEAEGWYFTYGFESDGTPLETRVYSDPLSADLDSDGLTDFQERLYGFHPGAVSQANVLEYNLSMHEQDAPMVTLRFDDPAGSMVYADSSGLGFSASCDTAGACPSAASGRYLGALRLDGDDYLTLANSAGQLTFAGNRPFTLGAWVYRQGAGTLLSKWGEAADQQRELRLSLNSSGNLVLTGLTGSGTLTTASSSGAVIENTWTHVAVTFNGSQAAFYINGTASGASAWGDNATYSAGTAPVSFMVGAYQAAGGPAGYFTGRLDEVAIFDRALSPQQVSDRLVQARYNFNDSFVRPGERIDYTSVVKNLLNSRFAYGLLTTVIDRVEAVIDAAARLLPRTFVLYPDNPVVTGVNTAALTDTLEIAADASSGPLTISQRVNAQIVDRRTESNRAELWLKFNEGASATTFEDSSGNMPPRSAACSTCPSRGETGVLNNAVRFAAGGASQVNIAGLAQMKLVDHGFTISMWVKPSFTSSDGAMVSLLDSAGSRLALRLARVDSGVEEGNYTPTLTINGSSVALTSGRNLIRGFWNHLAVQYNNATGVLKMYVNGAPSASASSVAGISLAGGTTEAAAWIGGSTMSADTWVDDVRIFSRPLTMLDINRLAERPVLQINMDGDTYADTSGYGQTVSQPHASVGLPAHNSSGIRGRSMTPGSGSSVGYLKVTGNSMLDMQDGAFTISTWVYPVPESATTWQGIWGYKEFDTEQVAADFPTLERSGADLRFGFDDGQAGTGYRNKVSLNVLSQNSWNHIVVTFMPAETTPVQYAYKLYINGVLKDSYLFSSHPRSASTFFVGHSSQKYTTAALQYRVESSDDAGSQAEPYLNEYQNGAYQGRIFGGGDGHDTDMHSTVDINHYDTLTGNQTISYEVYEDDDSSADDYCGTATYYWYNYPSENYTGMSNGFSGWLRTALWRPSIQFRGSIDELEVYRYALDSEQVYDLYNAIPITARLPLDDRPASDTFENRASLLSQDNGTCAGLACPAAGMLGLINQAVRFDGADDLITVPVTTTQDYMVSLWVNSTCAGCGIYSLKSGTTMLNQVYFTSGNICTLSGATRLCTRGGGYADGEWHHVVYANNGLAANLWIDGQIDNTLNNPPRVGVLANEQALLGTAPAAAHPAMIGQIDDVRVFLYSQAEDIVAQLNRRAPILLMHLDEADATTGMQDATPRDWSLECAANSDPAQDQCPLAGTQGRLGGAMEFDGVNDRAGLRQASLSSTTQSFTISQWVMPTAAVDHAQTLWQLGYPANNAYKYSLAIAPGSMHLCVLDGQTGVDCADQSTSELVMNNWNHVTLTVERVPALGPTAARERYQLYINGYLDSSGERNLNALAVDGMGRLVLGSASSDYPAQAGGAFAGRLDEVSLYEYLLNEIDIRDAFQYQMSEVEERDSLAITIDADSPVASFPSYNADFPYLAERDTLMQVDAADNLNGSGVGMLEMRVWHRNAIAPQWLAAPACLDSASGNAFCPLFVPQQGDGVYKLTFRATDRVGNQSQTPEYTLYVDGAGPRITSNQLDGSIQPAVPDPLRERTWYLQLSGKVSDETLNDGSAGSGVDPATVKVTVFSEGGEIVGSGTQIPTLTPSSDGYLWLLNYILLEREPSGLLRVVVEAADRAGNTSAREVPLFVDATAPAARILSGTPPEPAASQGLVAAGNPNPILTSSVLSGASTDTPPDGLPYITSAGKAAAAGVKDVEVSFAPSVEASLIFNEPYPDGLLAWLPLDSADPPLDAQGNPDPAAVERRFLDISPYQIAGACDMPACPDVMRAAHRAGAAYFNGSLQSINLGQQVDLAGRSFSVTVWARRDAPGRGEPVLWQGPASMPDQRFLFGQNEENRFVCGFGGTDLQTPEAYPDTAWHQWACTYNLDTRQRAIYRDGQRVAEDTAQPVARTNENLLVGLAPVGSFKGSLDDLVIYDRALSAEAVRDAYTGYQSVFHLAVESDFIANGSLVGDRSGYFQTGALQAAGEENRAAPGAAGDYALRFQGSDRLAVQPAFSLRLERGAFTLAAWIDPDGTGERDIFSERDENPEQRYPSLVLTADNRLKVGFGNGFQWLEVVTGGPVVTPGRWNHVAATFDGQQYHIYVDGLEVLASDAFAGLKPYSSERFNIGQGFTGRIDEAQIFTRPLSALEIQAMAAQGWTQAQLEADQTWQSSTPAGLEGPYEIEARGVDQLDHVRAEKDVHNQWGGLVDTLAPRLSLTREFLDPDQPFLATFTFTVEDTMLDETSLRQNLCQEVTLEKEYFNSAWFLALGNNPPNTSLWRVSGRCQGDTRTLEETGFYACDLGGNCVSETYPPMLDHLLYLPFISGLEGAPGQPPAGQGTDGPLRPDWPFLADTLMQQPAGQPPELEILTEKVGNASLRSLFHLNLQGRVSGLASKVSFRILDGGREVYAGQAAVYGDLWNAMWVFMPGRPPKDGAYTLEVAAVDGAGQTARARRTITVDLKP